MTFAVLLIALAAVQAEPGRKGPDFTVGDLRLHAIREKKAVVLLFMGVQCPLSRACEARLSDMKKKYPDVAFIALNANAHESKAFIDEHVKNSGFDIPVHKDEGGRIAGLYRVTIQPTAILLDSEFKIRYRGLVDDHKSEEFVRHPYLRDAIDAVREGREPKTALTQPVGCSIQPGERTVTSTDVTYVRDIAPILNKHCVSCHRPGQVGPFSLRTAKQARAWSQEIADYTENGLMPPWKPTTNPGQYYNERRLSKDQVALLRAWHENGAPLGDLDKAPEPPTFPDGWMLGEPDAVLKAEGGYVIGARGKDEYRCYVIENPFDKDVWISGVEYKPGNGNVVHHIIAYLDAYGQSRGLDARDPKPGYRSNGSGPNIIPSGSLGGWAPGNMPRRLPDGTGRLLRKGERIVLETHYHKSGREEVDTGAEIALHFAKKPVRRKMLYQMIANLGLRIPPGESAHAVKAGWTVPRDLHALDVMPHMHLLGRKMSVKAKLPDGGTRDLVVIDDWDFNWQETYQFRKPVALPKGTRVTLKAVYDNSEGNPDNPHHPPKMVKWGNETTDEMCIAFIGYTIDAQDLTQGD